MIIAIQNTIGAIRSFLGIVVSGLKMFLPFSSSQQLGEELVVNGDFSNGTTSWSEEGNSTISVGTYEGKTDVANINITDALSSSRIEQAFDYVNGKQYEVSVEVYLVNGSFRVDSSDTFVSGDFVSTTTTGSWQTLTATITAIQTGTNVIWLRSISQVSEFYVNSISVKEVAQFSLDKTTNNNNAKLFTGNCLDFDGINDYVDAGNPNISLKTLVFWINLDSTTEQVMTLTSSQSILISSGTITLNGTWSGSVIYVDNVVTSTISASSYKRVVITTTSAITVNDLEFGRIGSDYGGFKMSDVQIWNTAWSATDVANDYANPNQLVSSVSVSNLKGWWAFTEGSGTTAYDSSGEGNNGTIAGATYEPAQSSILQLGMINWSNGSGVFLPPNPSNATQDILGNAVRDRQNSLNLTGSGYSSVANSSTLQFGTDAFTIQAWIKPFSLAANNRILTKGVTGNGEFMISVGGDNASVRVFAKDSSGNSLDTSNDFSSLTINSWQMITVVIDTPNDQILFYKNDGNVETKTGASWTGNFNSTQLITIGNTSSVSAGQFFDGLVSDALVYDRALLATEVEQNYKAGESAHTN